MNKITADRVQEVLSSFKSSQKELGKNVWLLIWVSFSTGGLVCFLISNIIDDITTHTQITVYFIGLHTYLIFLFRGIILRSAYHALKLLASLCEEEKNKESY